MDNQEEYFEYSSKNYTAEQRKYNNDLTRGLLDLASTEGYGKFMCSHSPFQIQPFSCNKDDLTTPL